MFQHLLDEACLVCTARVVNKLRKYKNKYIEWTDVSQCHLNGSTSRHKSIKTSILSELTWANAISTAPPPGTSLASTITLRATFIASCRLRSTSLRMSLLAPRSMIVHALGFWHCTRNVKYLHTDKYFTTVPGPESWRPIPQIQSLRVCEAPRLIFNRK